MEAGDLWCMELRRTMPLPAQGILLNMLRTLASPENIALYTAFDVAAKENKSSGARFETIDINRPYCPTTRSSGHSSALSVFCWRWRERLTTFGQARSAVRSWDRFLFIMANLPLRLTRPEGAFNEFRCYSSASGAGVELYSVPRRNIWKLSRVTR